MGGLRRPAARGRHVLLVRRQGEDAVPGVRQRRARAIDEMDPLRRGLARNDHRSPAVLETAVAHEPVAVVAGVVDGAQIEGAHVLVGFPAAPYSPERGFLLRLQHPDPVVLVFLIRFHDEIENHGLTATMVGVAGN